MPRARLAVAAALFALLAPASASAHQGNPNYRSVINGVTPSAPGLRVQVLNGDDRLELTNHSGKDVLVPGYSGEPYMRVLADGTVQVNQRSEATYLNTERNGTASVPPSADNKAAPVWKTLDRTGRVQWHDHRIHWMGNGLPPQVTDKAKTAKVFDWKVPVRVGARTAAIRGTLSWVRPAGGGPPAAAIAGLVALVALGLLAVAAVRRRRRGAEGAAPDAPGAAEAW
jgi:hypothetical protein